MFDTNESIKEAYEKELLKSDGERMKLTMEIIDIRKKYRDFVDNEYKTRCEMMEKQIIKLWKENDKYQKDLKLQEKFDEIIELLKSKQSSKENE